MAAEMAKAMALGWEDAADKARSYVFSSCGCWVALAMSGCASRELARAGVPQRGCSSILQGRVDMRRTEARIATQDIRPALRVDRSA